MPTKESRGKYDVALSTGILRPRPTLMKGPWYFIFQESRTTCIFQAEKSSELFKLRQRESELHAVIRSLKELNCGGKQQDELPTNRGDN